MVEGYIQSMEPVYKNLIILLSILIILFFGVYVSYVVSDNKKDPIYLNQNTFDLFLNHSNINSVKSTTTVENVVVKEFNTIGQYDDLNFCPQGQCAVNLSSGVKRCPSTATNKASNNSNQISVTYNVGEEVCVAPESCPSQLPYAILSDGSASTTSCDPGTNCYCTSNIQCATKVVKYFENEGGKPAAVLQDEKNFSFAIAGQKLNANILNSLIIEDNSVNFCKLNPVFTDKIVNGCNFDNKWTDPIGCEYTNIFQLSNSTFLDFKVISYPETIILVPFAGKITEPDQTEYSKNTNFIGIQSTNTNLTNIDLQGIINRTGSFTLKGTSLIYKDSIIQGTTVVLKDIGNYKGSTFIPGLPETIKLGDSLTITGGFLTNCVGNDNDNVNFKNMLTCVQPYNQPCSEGVLAYNTNSPRDFCQGTGVSLSFSNIRNSFLVDPAFYTLSCVLGSGCDDSIDTTRCSSGTDCSDAIATKLSKLYPQQDLSALTNLFTVEPSSFGISFTPTITYKSSTNSFTLKNSLMQLETGDYWQINNSVNSVFLTSNGISGSNIINVNNTTTLKSGMSINFVQDFKIESISSTGTSVFLNANLNFQDTGLALTGTEIITYNTKNYFGSLKKIKGNQFQLLDLQNNIVGNEIDIENNYITFYKQFGFNGLNYNTIFDATNKTRIFNDDYYYKQFKQGTNISPPFSLLELLDVTQGEQDTNNLKLNSLLDNDNNFKQKYSMYYPVFNENYFRQECVYCNPSLNAHPYIDDSEGKIKGVNIQFSGQDFFHYAYGNVGNGFNYNRISFALTAFNNGDRNNVSTCSVIILNEPIDGLQIGDFIIDQTGFLYKTMIDENSIPKTGNFTLYDTSNLNCLPDDKYLPFKIGNRIFSPSNKFNFNPESNNFVEKLFYGKVYFDENNNENYIQPVVRISNISDDGKIIYTTSPSMLEIPEKTIIQFISNKDNLEIDTIEDPQEISKSTASGAKLEIESIVDGRIVSLKITDEGQGYNTLKPPLISLSKYSFDNSTLNISI